MPLHKLTTKQVKHATGVLGDGGNLYIKPSKGGTSRSWIFRYNYAGKPYVLGIGAYPTVGIHRAREKAAELRSLLAEGIDPRLARRGATRSPVTFEQASKQYIEAHREGWSERHAEVWVQSIRDHASGLLAKPVDSIATEDILSTLKPIWLTKNTTASRLRERIKAVLDYAAVRGWREPGPNPANWPDHLRHLLPKPSGIHTKTAMKSLPYAEIPALIEKLDTDALMAAQALKFTIFTASRRGEVLRARWDEIDLDQKLWIIPAARMKNDREHRVALSTQAIEALPPRSGEHIFSLNDDAMRRCLKKHGYSSVTTVHGFRSSFRNWCSDRRVRYEVAEMCLSHIVGNAVERSYNRADLLDERRDVLQRWADYLTETTAKIVPFEKATLSGAVGCV